MVSYRRCWLYYWEANSCRLCGELRAAVARSMRVTAGVGRHAVREIDVIAERHWRDVMSPVVPRAEQCEAVA